MSIKVTRDDRHIAAKFTDGDHYTRDPNTAHWVETGRAKYGRRVGTTMRLARLVAALRAGVEPPPLCDCKHCHAGGGTTCHLCCSEDVAGFENVRST